MPWDPTTQKGEIEVKGLRGMLRGPSNLVLPPEVAYLAENLDLTQGIAARRAGAVRLLGKTLTGFMGISFSNTTAEYISFPDAAPYDLGTKWAIAVHGKTTGTPGATQYLYSRDVTPTTAGKKTFALSIDTSRQLGVEVYVGGTNYALTASGGTVVGSATKFAALLVRDAASLALYLNGSSTAVASRADLPATTVTQPGAEAIYLGQNYDGSSRTGPFAGTIGWFGICQDFASVAQLLKYTTYQQYPDPKDPRWILWAGFGYTIEQSGAVAYDLSYLANNGTIVGSPARVAAITEVPVQRVQALFRFQNPATGDLQNVCLIGGDLYYANVRQS